MVMGKTRSRREEQDYKEEAGDNKVASTIVATRAPITWTKQPAAYPVSSIQGLFRVETTSAPISISYICFLGDTLPSQIVQAEPVAPATSGSIGSGQYAHQVIVCMYRGRRRGPTSIQAEVGPWKATVKFVAITTMTYLYSINKSVCPSPPPEITMV